MASPITTSGLASGIDTASMLAQLVQIQRQPIKTLQGKQSAISQKAAKLSDLTTKLTALKTAAEKLNTLDKVLAKSGSSSNVDVATVSATSLASSGKYALNVTSLATAEKDRTGGYASADAVVADGTIAFTVGGTTTNVDITGGTTTLADVVSLINASDAGVSATIVNDGNGAADSYRILLTSESTGYDPAGAASDALTIDNGTTGLGFSEIVTATNAQFSLDGQPETFTRQTNEFSDLVTGVTFSLVGAGATSVEVKTDATKVKEGVQAFVTAYNDVLTALNKEQSVSKDTNRLTSLAGESYIGLLQKRLDGVITASAGDTGGPYTSLASIGIQQSKTGTLSIDEDAFAQALSANATSVGKVFSNSTTGAAARLGDLADQFTNSVDGILTLGSKTLTKLTSSITNRISTLEDRVTSYEARMRRQFTAMEQTIAAVQAQGSRFTAMMGAF